MTGKTWARPTLVLLIAILISLLNASDLFSQTSSELSNGSLERWNERGSPDSWMLPPSMSRAGYRLTKDSDNAFAGETAALLDSTSHRADRKMFGNLMQAFDASAFRGKRVRFRAGVKTAELDAEGRAQLWLRVDRESINGQRRVGAFDNMRDRPIRDQNWNHYEIVAQIDEDAETVVLGLMLQGRGKAWLDDVSFDVIDDDTPVTTMSIGGSQTGRGPAVAPQPFFVFWLWLPLTAWVLFSLSQGTFDGRKLGWLYRFAFRFTFAYFLLYSIPKPLSSVVPYVGYRLASSYNALVDHLLRWAAPNILGIERELVAPNGSGDTTFAYVRVFLCFSIAIGIALVWSVADRRRSDYPWLKDLLRSYLRYVLALTMLGYGLAKVGWFMNQFPEPDVRRLMQPYGESSPMGLLWTFMGASRPYTLFAGLGEVLGAVLLIWRRTSTLGALVVVGVMANVVMLNFCYDVPVKLYSSHLLCMAFVLLLPELGRLSSLLVLNRPTDRVLLAPPYTNATTIWVQRCAKAAIILVGIAWPLGAKVIRELDAKDGGPARPAFYGYYNVDQFTRDGKAVPPLMTDGTRWKSVWFVRSRQAARGRLRPADFVSITMMNENVIRSEFRYSQKGHSISIQGLASTLQVKFVDEDRIELNGLMGRQDITAKLRRVSRDDFLLVNRGFHWINEYPHNR